MYFEPDAAQGSDTDVDVNLHIRCWGGGCSDYAGIPLQRLHTVRMTMNKQRNP